MGFFKDFKDDFTEAVDELVSGETAAEEEEVMVNTLDGEIDVDTELSKLDGLLEQVSKKVEAPAPAVVPAPQPEVSPAPERKPLFTASKENKSEASVKMDTMVDNAAQQMTAQVSDEVAIITSGMTIRGNMDSVGSIEVQGSIDGDVRCNGKLVVTGHISGNSASSEFFADAAKIEGEVVTTGTAKVGVGSVIIGNITATSAVIAGAVKGDIDVNGPVVVDTSAVVMGNIKSRSVQINNGAVIEGFCSQSYADVDVDSVFR